MNLKDLMQQDLPGADSGVGGDVNHAAHEAAHSAAEVKARATHGAREARTTWLEYGAQALRLVGALRALELGSVSSVLARVGLSRKASPMGPALWFTAGAVVGGGAALVFAPMSGKELRSRASKFLTPSRAVSTPSTYPTARKKDGYTRGYEGVEPLPRAHDGAGTSWP